MCFWEFQWRQERQKAVESNKHYSHPYYYPGYFYPLRFFLHLLHLFTSLTLPFTLTLAHIAQIQLEILDYHKNTAKIRFFERWFTESVNILTDFHIWERQIHVYLLLVHHVGGY